MTNQITGTDKLVGNVQSDNRNWVCWKVMTNEITDTDNPVGNGLSDNSEQITLGVIANEITGTEMLFANHIKITDKLASNSQSDHSNWLITGNDQTLPLQSDIIFESVTLICTTYV